MCFECVGRAGRTCYHVAHEGARGSLKLTQLIETFTEEYFWRMMKFAWCDFEMESVGVSVNFSEPLVLSCTICHQDRDDLPAKFIASSLWPSAPLRF